MCCFCGGITPATEEDHFPSRALFIARVWPEGYAFPACAQCNRATRHDEMIVALMSRLHKMDPVTPLETEELRRCLAAVCREFPGLLESMMPKTHRELRTARKKYGLTLQPGQASTDLPVIKVEDDRIHRAILNFGHKLGLALYYKQTGKPLPASGAVALRWYSNVQVESDAIPRQLADVLPRFPKLARGKTVLSDQFFYRIGIAKEGTIGTFLAIFRSAFAIVRFVSVAASDFSGDEGPMKVIPVYRWTPA